MGRKGSHYLDEAENLYETYLEPNINLHYKMKTRSLLSLLLSCRIHNDMIRAERIVDKINIISNIDGKVDNDVAARMYVTLLNIYTQNNDFEKVNEIREIMKQKKIKKNRQYHGLK